MDSPLNSNIEVTRNPDGTVETSKVDTPINPSEQMKKSTPKKTKFIPPGVSTVESFHEEVHTSGITVNISNMDVNVTMGEGVLDTSPQEGPKTINDDETDYGGFVGSFASIEFDPNEEDVPDHMLMSGKQFKILNRKLNSLLQLQVYGGGKDSVSGIEVDVMLKAQEHCIQDKLDQIYKNNELRDKSKFESFNGALRALKDVAKERHVMYVQDVKTIRENVNLPNGFCHDNSYSHSLSHQLPSSPFYHPPFDKCS
ncbi:unnamed protein product [Lactuca saligna]|uniref:Uncharacterized protein n=1 Tax=Lactuca saligna TaxID=75948 RepID=A0AA35V8B8_LACSI|nr:unnamed protein product [Lactuca saligna]